MPAGFELSLTQTYYTFYVKPNLDKSFCDITNKKIENFKLVWKTIAEISGKVFSKAVSFQHGSRYYST